MGKVFELIALIICVIFVRFHMKNSNFVKLCGIELRYVKRLRSVRLIT